MNFAEIPFLFVFFPLCVGCYLFTKQIRYRNAVLLTFSLLFYAWGEPLKLEIGKASCRERVWRQV